MSQYNRSIELPFAAQHAESVEFAYQNRKRGTIYGFAGALAMLALLLFLLSLLDISPYIRQPERQTIPIQLLQLGNGATTGSSGNLTEEGATAKAVPSPEPLADARVERLKSKPVEKAIVKPEPLAKRQPAPTQIVREFTNNAFPKPAKEVMTSPTSPALTASQSKQLSAAQPTAAKTEENGSAKGKLLADASGGVGVYDGGDGGGLGRFGAGSGRGAGYGLEWGGGGNRVVLHKELPKYPNGVNTSAQIKVRFTVLPNGSVGIAMPMQKGEPILERAALEALRRWQFNPTNDNKEMVGFITFTFRVQ